MAGLDENGFTPATLQEVQAEMNASLLANVSPALNLSSTSILGQYTGSTAIQIRMVWEALQALWASWDINTAQGAELDRLAAIVGVYRHGATYSTVQLDVVLDAGVYLAGVLIVSKVGEPNSRFVNVDDVTSPGGLNTGVSFRADQTGPITGAAGQISVIANPITGFTSATNPDDVAPGDVIESDSDFRLRITQELALAGSTTVDGIRADLLQQTASDGTPMFSFVSVIENDTDVTDGDGRPPHSFESIVVSGAPSLEIATAIMNAKPAGIQAYGTEPAEFPQDSQGNTHTIRFSFPDGVPVYITLNNLYYTPGIYVGDQAVKDAVIAYAEQNIGVGADVILMRIAQVVMSLAGVQDVSVLLGSSFGGQVASNLVITARQISQWSDTPANRFTVNSIARTSPP